MPTSTSLSLISLVRASRPRLRAARSRLAIAGLLTAAVGLTACSSPEPRPDPRPGLRQRDKQQQRELDRYAPPKASSAASRGRQ